MKLIFVGTGSGRTGLKRHHSSLLFENDSEKVLVDVGEGTSKALLKLSVDVNSITEIIFSHYHSDHFAGLPSLITQMIINKRSLPLRIYTHSGLINSLIQFLEISYIFINKLDFDFTIAGFEFESTTILFNEFSFIARQNSHITNKHNIDSTDINFLSSSFLFNLPAEKVIYTSDIGSKDDLYLFSEIYADLFITETTHIPLDEIEKSAIIQNPKKTILTHIDYSQEKDIIAWLDSLSESNNKRFIIAEDGMEIKM